MASNVDIFTFMFGVYVQSKLCQSAAKRGHLTVQSFEVVIRACLYNYRLIPVLFINGSFPLVIALIAKDDSGSLS